MIASCWPFIDDLVRRDEASQEREERDRARQEDEDKRHNDMLQARLRHPRERVTDMPIFTSFNDPDSTLVTDHETMAGKRKQNDPSRRLSSWTPLSTLIQV